MKAVKVKQLDQNGRYYLLKQLFAIKLNVHWWASNSDKLTLICHHAKHNSQPTARTLIWRHLRCKMIIALHFSEIVRTHFLGKGVMCACVPIYFSLYVFTKMSLILRFRSANSFRWRCSEFHSYIMNTIFVVKEQMKNLRTSFETVSGFCSHCTSGNIKMLCPLTQESSREYIGNGRSEKWHLLPSFILTNSSRKLVS